MFLMVTGVKSPAEVPEASAEESAELLAEPHAVRLRARIAVDAAKIPARREIFMGR